MWAQEGASSALQCVAWCKCQNFSCIPTHCSNITIFTLPQAKFIIIFRIFDLMTCFVFTRIFLNGLFRRRAPSSFKNFSVNWKGENDKLCFMVRFCPKRPWIVPEKSAAEKHHPSKMFADLLSKALSININHFVVVFHVDHDSWQKSCDHEDKSVLF